MLKLVYEAKPKHRKESDMRYSASLFSQILSLIPQTQFNSIVNRYAGNRYAKTFSCWHQLVAMLFCQLGQAHSLREICGGLATCLGKLQHLGMHASPKRSTLARANENRSWEIFQELFFVLLQSAQREFNGKRKFRFKNKLYSLDSSVIDLCASLFDWAKFRRTKGAVKLHLLLDHDGYLPSYAHITDGKTHDIAIARSLDMAPGSIIAMDRAYIDFDLFAKWTENQVYFVTRLKENLLYEITEVFSVPEKSNILLDCNIQLTSGKARRVCPFPLRLVMVWDSQNQRCIKLLTNHQALAASTIAAIYKERWQIEIFFKMLKQNLKVKTFIGTSANALKIQIWTALIVILLLKIMQFRSTLNWSLSNLIALLRMNLFTYRNLHHWLDDPFRTPAKPPSDTQLMLDGIFAGQHKGAWK